ncbi:MAG: hypothetical protein IPM42_10855 [Saprospiraceae bacterium]|nr:hypothetical protein [Saprospiraceae bacterium]
MNLLKYSLFQLVLFIFPVSAVISQKDFSHYSKDSYFNFGEPGAKCIEHSEKWYKVESFQDTTYSGIKIRPKSFNFIKDSSDFVNKFDHIKFLQIEPEVRLFNPRDTTKYFVPPVSNLKNIEFIYLTGDFKWDYDSLWLQLLSLPKLKFLGIRNLAGNIQYSENLNILLAKIEGLYFQGQNLQLPDPSEYQSKLQYLNFSGFNKDISPLLKTVSELNLLHYLVLEKTPITKPDIENIVKTDKLKYFKCNYGIIEDTEYFISKIADLDSLEALELSFVTNDKIPDNFHFFKRLRYLKINNGYKNESPFPNSIFDIKSLKSLDFSNFSDTIISHKIKNLQNLEYLQIKFSGKELPDEICKLKSLKSIIIRNGYLQKLPKNIGNLSYLETLDLYYNEIRYLPKSVGDLRNLIHLDLSNNYLIELPQSIGSLVNLEHLNLNTNFITIIRQK